MLTNFETLTRCGGKTNPLIVDYRDLLDSTEFAEFILEIALLRTNAESKDAQNA